MTSCTLIACHRYPVPVKAETSTRTEEIIGTWLASRGCRDKVILATKVTSYMPNLDRSAVVAKRSEMCRCTLASRV